MNFLVALSNTYALSNLYNTISIILAAFVFFFNFFFVKYVVMRLQKRQSRNNYYHTPFPIGFHNLTCDLSHEPPSLAPPKPPKPKPVPVKIAKPIVIKTSPPEEKEEKGIGLTYRSTEIVTM